MTTADAVGFIDDNLLAVGLRTVRGDLHQAIASGRPFIAFVVEGQDGHAVFVLEVREDEGIRSLVVLDPAIGAYLERVEDFARRLARDRSVVGHPAIWGE